MARRTADIEYEIDRPSRDAFLNDGYWHYNAGEHVSFIGPTQTGKTTLAFQLLQKTTSPDLQALVLVMKPKDKVPVRMMEELGYRRVQSWPPVTATKWNPNPPSGWVVWPKLGDIDNDDVELRKVFYRALAESYSGTARKNAKDRIIFADEIVGLTKELKLEKQLKAIWMRGSSMGLGLWAATQRPFDAPLLMYNSANHIFIHKDPDRRNVERLRDMGGVNQDLIIETLASMQRHEFLYIRRSDDTMCIVGT